MTAGILQAPYSSWVVAHFLSRLLLDLLNPQSHLAGYARSWQLAIVPSSDPEPVTGRGQDFFVNIKLAAPTGVQALSRHPTPSSRARSLNPRNQKKPEPYMPEPAPEQLGHEGKAYERVVSYQILQGIHNIARFQGYFPKAKHILNPKP